eukprot:2270789-Amphidinium_carterae.1
MVVRWSFSKMRLQHELKHCAWISHSVTRNEVENTSSQLKTDSEKVSVMAVTMKFRVQWDRK